MPNSVDKRIVEMEFDNSRFEKNINESINSLEKLDKALQLDDAAKNFNKIEKAANEIDLSKLDRTLDTLEHRFSTMGIVGATAVGEITKSVMNLGKTLYNNTIGQIKSGGMARALNIESAKFQLEGLGVAWDDIKDDINYGVKGTAYGLDVAAKAASQLTASGIEMGEEMKQALRGISGVAAMTNSSYESISPIFTTIAGQGRVMTMQLRQLESRGLNAAATLAKHLKVSEEEVRDMVTKGKIDFRTFSEAMDDAFGAHAKDANKTFTGALSNMKAALSRIGADFATPYMENMRLIFVELTDVIDDAHTALKPLITSVSNLMGKIREVTISLFKSKTFVAVYQSIITTISSLAEKLYSFIDDLKVNSGIFESIKDFIFGIGDAIGIVMDILKVALNTAHPVLDILNIALGVIIRLLGALGRFITSLRQSQKISGIISSVITVIKTALLLIIIVIHRVIKGITDLVKAFAGAPIIHDIFDNIKNVMYNLASRVFPLFAKAIILVAYGFNKLISVLKGLELTNVFKNLNDKFAKFLNIIKKGKSPLKSFVNLFKDGVGFLPKPIKAFAKSLNETDKEIHKITQAGGMGSVLETFRGILSKFGNVIGSVFNIIIENIKKFGIARSLIVGMAGSLIALFGSGARLASSFNKSLKGVPRLIKSIAKSFEAPLFEAKAKAIIIGLAVGIGALTLSLVALTKLNQTALREVAYSLSILIGVISIAGVVINKLGGGFSGLATIAISFISFTAGVLILVGALKALNDLEADWELAKKVLVLVAIMGSFGLVITLMSRFAKPWSLLFGSGFMLSFALSIKMLVKALAELATMPIDSINAAMDPLVEMMEMLALIGAACSLLSPFAGLSFDAIVAGVLGFIWGLKTLLADIDPQTFEYITRLINIISDSVTDWTESIKGVLIVNGFVKIAQSLAEIFKGKLVRAIEAFVKPAVIAAEALKTFGKAAVIGSIVAGLIGIALAIGYLGKLKPEEILQGSIMMGLISVAFLGMMAALMAMQKYILGDKKFLDGFGEAFGGLAAILLSIAISMKILSGIEIHDLAKAGGAVTVMMVVLTILMTAISYLADGSNMIQVGIGTAFALSTLLLAISLAIGLLSMLVTDGDWVPLITAASAVGIIMLGVAAICKSLAGIETKPALAATFGLAVLFAALGGVFYVLANMVDPTTLFINLFGMGVAIGGMIFVIYKLKEMDEQDIDKSLSALYGLMLVFGVFTGVLALMRFIDVDSMIPGLVGVGAAISVLSIILYGLAGLDTDKIKTASLAMIGLAVVFAGFSAACLLLRNIQPETLLPNLLGVVVAIGVMSGILFLLGKIPIQNAVIGVVLMAVITAIFAALAYVAKIVESIDTMTFLKNIGVLAIAVGGLTAIMAVLGAIMMSGAGAGILIAGAIALLALAGVMAVFAGVGHLFASAAEHVAAAFNELGPALTIVGTGLQDFASKDFSGILENILTLVATIEGINLIKGDLEKASNNISLLGSSMNDLYTNASSLSSVLPTMETSVTNLKTIIEDLATIMTTLADAMDTAIKKVESPEFQNIMVSIGNVFKESSVTEMHSVGIKMVEDIASGFKETATADAPNMIYDFCGGLQAGADTHSGWVWDIGLQLGAAFVEGFRSEDGINSHSNAIEAILAMFDWGGGIEEGGDKIMPLVGDTGTGLAGELVGTFCTGLEDGEPITLDTAKGIIENIKDVAANTDITTYIDVALGSVDERLSGLGLFGSKGLTKAQKASNASEDKKRADMQGYANLDQFLRAQQLGLVKTEKAADKTTEALDKETTATKKNSKATGGSSKAKAENEKANEGKTKAINEETEAINEETEAVEDNEQEIRDQAEQIEIVTEKYKEYLNTFKYTDPLKNATRLTKAFSKLWSASNETTGDVSKTYKNVSKSLSNSLKTVSKRVLAFDDTGKKLGRLSNNLYNNVNKIEKKVSSTGKTIMKVMGSTTKVFYKNGGKVEKFTMSTTKTMSKLGKQFKDARNFVNSFNADIGHTESSEEFIKTLRSIEQYFGANKLGQMTKKTQGYLKGIATEFSDVSNSMNILGKNIDGVGNIMSKKSKSTAYVVDGFLALAASLYDGSEAANEYATEHARLMFLLENGLATEEEVDEHFQSYLSRIKQALVDYRNTIYDNLSGSMDIWSEFNKNLMDESTDLISNIESQIAGYMNWSNMLMELSKRGLDSNLVKMLTDEGVSSFGKAQKLIEMTGDELALFTIRYQQSQKAIETATDTALAAVANAQTMASLRAAAAQGDKTAQKQLKQSTKNKKALISDAKAVADYQAQYNKMTAKEEKAYLKTLTKQERKAYKDQLKAAKKQQKELEAGAKREEAARAEKERLQGIMDSIKSIQDYTTAIQKYSGDASAMNKITTEMAKAFEPIKSTLDGITVSTGTAEEAIFAFAETLDATGEEGLNYFEEMSKRIQNFTDEIKNSITSVNMLTTAFGSVEKISLEDIYNKNILSNITGNINTSTALDSLSKKGYNSYVLKMVVDTYKSDRAQGLQLMQELSKANADYVGKINASYEVAYEEASNIADKTTNLMANASSKESLQREVDRRKKALDDANAYAKQKEKELSNKRTELINAEKEAQAKAVADKAIADEKARKKELKDTLKKNGKLTKAQEKEYIKLLKKYGGTYKGVIYQVTADTISASKVASVNMVDILNDAVKTLENEVSAAYEEVNKKTEEWLKSQEALNKYIADMNKYMTEVVNDANVKAWFDTNITSVEAMTNALKNFGASTGEYKKVKAAIAEIMVEFSDAVGVFDATENFTSIKSLAGLSEPLSVIEDGILRFGQTLVDTTENAEDFYAALKQGLIDYQKQLKSSIESSSDFFSMFSGFSDEDNPLTATNYLEYADSQINALETWSANLKKLADMGLDKELVEKFASQGLSSYEQVNAWVNATAAQIGEYNEQWRRYNETVESASNAAMASIGAAWSKAGEALQESMISAFGGNSERFEQVGYEASAMVITGMKNGLEGGLTTVISSTVKNMSTSDMATALGNSVGQSINDGLVKAIQASVEDTVTAAVEKFKMAVDSVNLYVQENLQSEYTITIHIDTSEIDAAVARMNAAVSGVNTQALTTSGAVTTSQANQAASADNSTSEPTVVTNNITYNQTNNSPKELSQVDIYRNTQSQLNDLSVKLSMAGG